MCIVTNDPFDSMGFGIEWLKQLGLTAKEILASPLREATTNLNGDVIIVRRVKGKPVTIAVFNEKYPAKDAIAFVLAQKYERN